MSTLLFSTTILAAFVGGVLALLAPCCISVMLPAYFASTFRQRTRIVAMTLVFAAGVGTVILPIALGATVLSRLLLGQHAWVFGIGGLLMIGAGLAMLAGRTFALPMLGGRAASGTGVRAVYGLGVFSGGASACCAPVLVGVAALAGATASFPVALAVGVAYVFGMVAPLSVIALVWDRRDWGASAFLRDRRVTLGVRGHQRTLPLTTVVSATLMVLMGALTSALALSGRGMTASGWQVTVSARLQHFAADVTGAVSVLPGWVGTAAVFGALAVLVRIGLRQHRGARSAQLDPATPAAVGGVPAAPDLSRDGSPGRAEPAMSSPDRDHPKEFTS